MKSKGSDTNEIKRGSSLEEDSRAVRDPGNCIPITVEITPERCERIVLAAQRELAVVTLERQFRLLPDLTAAIGRIEDVLLQGTPQFRSAVHGQKRYQLNPSGDLDDSRLQRCG